jgi:hypothetical protein
MLRRAIVIIILTALTLFPGPKVRARALSEGRTPLSDSYGQAWDASASVRSQEPLAPYPLTERRPAKAERLFAEAVAASAEFGRSVPIRITAERAPMPVSGGVGAASAGFSDRPLEPTPRVASRTTRYDVEPIHNAAYDLPTATVATCTVTTRADSGPGSLRACLSQAAANGTILFDPVVFPPAAPVTITPVTALPSIAVDHLTIDGSNAGVVLDGSSLSTGAGLVINGADGTVIRGLQILHFRFGVALINGARSAVVGGDRSIGSAPLGQGNLISGSRYSGVILQGSGTANNQVVGNIIGTDAAGTKAVPNGEHGVAIVLGASSNTLGGITVGLRNLLSGNARAGVMMDDSGTSGNKVLGNYIGTDATGANALPNNGDGVDIVGEATDNIVGGEAPGSRNLISGNGDTGVWVEGSSTSGNRVLGNIIGADASGTRALGNVRFGVFIGFGANNNVVGGDAPGAGNLISGNSNGVWIEGDSTTGNHIQGNFIGTDSAGTRAISNTVDGVVLYLGAKNNLVGGDTPGAGNLISGNGRIGVNINKDCFGNRILGNTVGTDASGAVALGNGESGVLVGFGAHDNVVGGATIGARNLVGGNGLFGVLIKDAGTSGNRVMGNIIGTNALGTIALRNAADGVLIGFGAHDNTIGGAASGEGNLISGNEVSGVWIRDAGTARNQVLGNIIGADAAGTRALSNGNDGITIINGAGSNVIGGDAPGAGNLISGNGDRGITIEGRGSDANRVLGNVIGADMTGTKALGNFGGGVVIMSGASNNVVGGDTPGARNLISGNDDGNDETEEAGIWIEDADTAGNRVVGNYIGTDVTGAVVLGNGDTGIGLGLGAHDTVIGGETPAAANVISGNGGHGVALQQAGTDGNRITGNIIGLDATGTYSMTNGDTGVFVGFAASNNVVGGENPGARNLINGGVWLQSLGTTGNRVVGNYIGTDSNGTAAPGNRGNGVALIDGPSDNVVGGETSAARNIISGNAEHGVFMQGAGTTANEVKGNTIGTDVTGARPLGNGLVGVLIMHGASGNLVGGNSEGARNIISGNRLYGVQLQDPGTSGNRLQSNYIGTDASGTAAVPNAKDGVVISEGASNNLVGGEMPVERNLISGNGEIGVNLAVDVTGNRVLGNYIGTNVAGTQAVGNGQSGVHIGFGAFDNVVGGDRPGMRNIISGNASAGVLIKNPGTSGNSVLGNTIGADVNGTRKIPNALDGVAICCAASGNVVGGEAPGEGNLISANSRTGVWMEDTGTSRNRVAGNIIGADVLGAGALGNLQGGVAFVEGSQANILGPGNLILFNGLAGVTIRGETTLRNTITRNSIHHNGGPPIEFMDLPRPIDAPALHRYLAASHALTGLACPSCRVEVSANPDAQPAGTVYLAAGTADAAGAFTVMLSGRPPLPFLHTTATDAVGTTSEFSSGLNTDRMRIYMPIVLR